MNVLDELRDLIQDGPTWRASSWKQWKDEVISAIDAFEAAHPGLVDRTVRCRDCGQPTMDSGDGFTICPACAQDATP